MEKKVNKKSRLSENINFPLKPHFFLVIMSDASLPTVRPKHSRSTSITTQKKSTHQRKPSLSQLPIASSENIKRTRPTSISGNSSSTNKSNVPGFLNNIISRVFTFLNPTGPLLPHSKHTNAFGGTIKSSFISRLFQSRLVRVFTLFYVIFSVCLTVQHSWHYIMSPKENPVKEPSIGLDEKFNDDWKPQRTYDQGKKIFYTFIRLLTLFFFRGNILTS